MLTLDKSLYQLPITRALPFCCVHLQELFLHLSRSVLNWFSNLLVSVD